MKFDLDPILFQAVPDFKIGINHYTNITVSESPQMVKGRLQLFQEQIFFDLENKSITDFPGIKEWRTVWKLLGADPNRYRHSTEALLRRIKKLNYIDPVHSAVDLNNFFSLQYEIPIGIYDAERLTGDIMISLSKENEGYEGLNGRFNSLKSILTLKDNESSFGSPYIDSIRTAVTDTTTEAFQVFFLRPSLDLSESVALTTASGKMFTDISGGASYSHILHEGQTSIIIK